jgi:NADH dehydrogenase
MADLAVEAAHREENTVIDAVGPEIFTFHELVGLIAQKLGRRVLFMRVNPGLAFFLAGLVGKVVRDVVLTGDEVRGLMENLLVSGEPPTGKKYASELNRHYR